MNEHSRRIDDRDDHDALIKLDGKLTYLCETVKEIKKAQSEQTIACSCRMRDCTRFFVPSKVFYTALAIIVLFLGTVGVATYETKESLAEYKGQLETVVGHLDHALPQIDLQDDLDN